MAKNTQMADATVNAQADALSDLLDNGYLRIYDGTQPATADTAVSTQTLLAELRFNATASGAASGGVITMNSITSDSSANASGTATWFRCLKSDGSTVVMDGNVGVTGSTSNLELATTTITVGVQVSVSNFTHDVKNSSSGL
jgi:hypothetical protein